MGLQVWCCACWFDSVCWCYFGFTFCCLSIMVWNLFWVGFGMVLLGVLGGLDVC